jgi:hypothetical protein
MKTKSFKFGMATMVAVLISITLNSQPPENTPVPVCPFPDPVYTVFFPNSNCCDWYFQCKMVLPTQGDVRQICIGTWNLKLVIIHGEPVAMELLVEEQIRGVPMKPNLAGVEPGDAPIPLYNRVVE